MRITISKVDGLVGIDGVFRAVDLGALGASVSVIQFDTVDGAGHIEFDAKATIAAQQRDAEAEAAAYAACDDDPVKLAALQPIWKTVQVRRDNEQLISFEAYQSYIEAWAAAAPPPPPPHPPTPTAVEISVAAGGGARRERTLRRLARADPMQALLIKGGLK